MSGFIVFMYISTISIAWILGIACLFKVNELLGLAAILYLVSTWFKAWGRSKAEDEERYKELRVKLVREGSLKE